MAKTCEGPCLYCCTPHNTRYINSLVRVVGITGNQKNCLLKELGGVVLVETSLFRI